MSPESRRNDRFSLGTATILSTDRILAKESSQWLDVYRRKFKDESGKEVGVLDIASNQILDSHLSLRFSPSVCSYRFYSSSMFRPRLTSDFAFGQFPPSTESLGVLREKGTESSK